MFGLMSNFHPLAVVDRGSETQLQVGENLNYLIWRLKDFNPFSAGTDFRRQILTFIDVRF